MTLCSPRTPCHPMQLIHANLPGRKKNNGSQTKRIQTLSLALASLGSVCKHREASDVLLRHSFLHAGKVERGNCPPCRRPLLVSRGEIPAYDWTAGEVMGTPEDEKKAASFAKRFSWEFQPHHILGTEESDQQFKRSWLFAARFRHF